MKEENEKNGSSDLVVFLYTNSKLSENVIRKTIPFAIVTTKNMLKNTLNQRSERLVPKIIKR